MKKEGIVLFVGFVLLAIQVIAQDNKSEAFNYKGSNWDKYEGHRLTMVVLDTSVGGTKLIAEQIIRDGKFNVSGSISYPQNAFFGLYNSNGDFVYKKEFIIEPGKLTIDLDKQTDDIVLTGGKYNPIFSGIEKDPKYLALLAALNEFSAATKPEDFRKDSSKARKYNDLSRAAMKYKMDVYNQIRSNNPDPYARLLAVYHSDRSVRFDEQLSELERELGLLPEIAYLRYSARAAQKRRMNSQAIKVGTVIKDFKSESIAGAPFHLAKSLKENKYTLVEFWASWCGPCRAEIPHMKTAYEKFHDKGFEIVSFTLDHERDRWVKASTEENIPWVNVGDLMAFKSPVVTMFGISGIPANYLVDSSGKIIATNLRQNKLDEKLAELL
jgi:thiol-disulfide isomerase/thioredoxin